MVVSLRTYTRPMRYTSVYYCTTGVSTENVFFCCFFFASFVSFLFVSHMICKINNNNNGSARFQHHKYAFSTMNTQNLYDYSFRSTRTTHPRRCWKRKRLRLRQINRHRQIHTYTTERHSHWSASLSLSFSKHKYDKETKNNSKKKKLYDNCCYWIYIVGRTLGTGLGQTSTTKKRALLASIARKINAIVSRTSVPIDSHRIDCKKF